MTPASNRSKAERVTDRASAQARIDRVRAFRDELAALEREGVTLPDPDTRSCMDAHHEALIADLRERFDVDIDGSQKRFSLGMRIASLIGALALSAAVFFFFYRIWGLLNTPVQVILLIVAPIAATFLAGYAHRRERTGYFTALAALVAVACFVLDLSVLGQTFNLVPSRNAFLAWALFALILAYSWGLKLVLTAGLVSLIAYLSATVGAWGGLYWLSFGERPETILIAGLLITLPGWFGNLPRPEFSNVYRVFGFLVAFISVLVLSHWGRASFLPFSPSLVEAGYQLAGFVGSAVLIAVGIRRGEGKLFNLGATFFLLFFYTKIFDWWWDWMPKWLFFLVVGLVAVGFLFILGRLRRTGHAGDGS
ncbi:MULTISPECIES: DUF2157 domain-containing protein [unclassified Wenzhouxiangella]|uniref:DUF2157 domain-containing protein n=1 Tax=unclassified Wenzhouxiangella TaxID=2613841 RepID=UPI000E324F9B|nr:MULTISPECIES: DUF2157 domain-containing protein [unclassified Wenzhouxiangella]RFF26420.1 DUF2157 domain-containing protein [Wenzhouxiangella sp. 15181]RFP67307.1 DUF2157 domain-containing protein [Wenzhouxiangella sp. 15190]